MARSWPFWVGGALIALYIIRFLIEGPVPGYIQFLTSLVLPAAFIIIGFGYWSRRNLDRKGDVKRTGETDAQSEARHAREEREASA